MVETNSLLTAAIALISSPMNTVHVPPQSAPGEAKDVVKFYVGLPGNPTDMFLTTAHGDWYGIHKGTVSRFTSAKSFFNQADNAQWSDFTGEATLSSNQVIELAARTIQRLTKRGPPLTNVTPRMNRPVLFQGKEIAFCVLNWLSPDKLGSADAAELEIDARTGFVVQVHLWNPRFDDPAADRELRDKWFSSDFSTHPHQAVGIPFEHPTTNQVSSAIGGWLAYCRALGLDSGTRTNLMDIDWEKTVLCTNDALSATVPVYRVVFKNGTLFDSFGEAITCHAGPDVCFSSGYMNKSASELPVCFGVVTKDWEELATNVEHNIAILLRAGGGQLQACRRWRVHASAKIGERGLARTMVLWRRMDSDPMQVDGPFLFSAELDLRTGKTKSIGFSDPELVKMVGHSLSKLRRN